MKRLATQRAFPFLLTLTLICTMFPFSSSAADPTKDSLDQVKKNLTDSKAVLVDVREVVETDDGHVDGAILVPLSLLNEGQSDKAFAAKLAEQVPAKTIVYTYCKAGVRSQAAAEILAKYKYDVRALRQGYEELVSEGFESSK